MSLLRSPVTIALAAMVALPFALLAGGLTLTSATDVVIIAIACMALNILVGHTGLVSFGHGAWFGIGAYAAALAQRHWFAGSVLWPAVFALLFLLVAAVLIAFIVLRRRGVYFSLLTMAFAALSYAIAFRWTSFTGGENGLGGVTRAVWLGVDLEAPWVYYTLVAAIGLTVVMLLSRFHRSPVGTVLVALRENEVRAQFVGYPITRYKQIAYVLSALLTGFAGVLSAFHHRFASADPLSVSFSGELLAMVIIGGMRSLLGPALGALFYVLFREYLSIWTSDWLLYFGLLFVAFIVYSPTGLVGVWRRLTTPMRAPAPHEAAAMAGRTAAELVPLPDFLKPNAAPAATLPLEARELAKAFGGIRAVERASLSVEPRTLHALIGPNGAGKTTMFNLMSGMFAPDTGTISVDGRDITGLAPHRSVATGLARSFQITQLFAGATVAENLRLAVQAGDRSRFDVWHDALKIERVQARTAELTRFLGLAGMEAAPAGSLSYGGQRLLDMGLALATAPRILLLDEPLAGLAAAERERVAMLIKRIASDIPVLLVEHDIDRVFALADRVTVMNEGRVLLDGSAEDARQSAKLREVYIGSGTAALAAQARGKRERPDRVLLNVNRLNAYYGKSHVIRDASLSVREGEIVALLGRNGAGKSTLLKSIIGIADARGELTLGSDALAGRTAAAIARLGIGYVPQGRALFAGMSVRHNLELGRLKRGQSGSAWSEERILQFFPRLKGRLDAPADFLSGGEQQMVAVARALSGHVRLLLLDEPFEGLAPAVIEELFEAFDKLRQEISMVIVEHNLDLVLALADHAYVLERGSVVHHGPAADLRDNLDLRRSVLWM